MTATDEDGDGLTFGTQTLPAWLTFDGDDTISGTPQQGDVGVHNVVVTVTDGFVAMPVQQSFQITVTNVNDPPEFSSVAPTGAAQGTLYTYDIVTDDPDPLDVLTITGPTVPAWLVLTDNGDRTATLTGTPTNDDVGDHDVSLQVSDGTLTATQSFAITVSNTNDLPTFTSTPVTAATQDLPYAYSIAVTDPDAGDTLAITAPTLPVWLTFADNGNGTAMLTGTPTNSNVFTAGMLYELASVERTRCGP